MNALKAALAVALAATSFAAQAVGHRADVVLFDRATSRELPVHWHEGRAYVVGRPGAEYEVRVRNQRGEDLLAVVSVDGLNVMNGQAANPRQAGYIISPWQSVEVKGWRKSMEEVASFYFTQLANSYAGRTGRPDNVGVIGVALFERKRVEYAPALRERSEAQRDSVNESRAKSLQAPAPAASAPLGTGHGRREESRVQWQHFDRATDTPVETIAIYYDSYRNLVAMGVLQAPTARRDPNPWPTSFTPDP
ncbi:MAG TPA: hypothetical protein VM051_10595 [Usitatibacter sp.]|nr:hypothetical protein [Usitatibacter sp.]